MAVINTTLQQNLATEILEDTENVQKIMYKVITVLITILVK